MTNPVQETRLKKASVEDLNADEDRQMGNCLLHVILEINVDGDLRQ